MGRKARRKLASDLNHEKQTSSQASTVDRHPRSTSDDDQRRPDQTEALELKLRSHNKKYVAPHRGCSLTDHQLARNGLGASSGHEEIGLAAIASMNQTDQQESHPAHQRSIHPLGVTHPQLIKLKNGPSVQGTLPQTGLGHRIMDHREGFERSNLGQDPETRSDYSMIVVGMLMFTCSSLLWMLGIPLVLFDFDGLIHRSRVSNELANYETDHPIRHRLRQVWIQILSDQHYKFFIPLQITFGLVFIIINWGGLKIFRHS